jgi:hypothetical protein
MFDSTVASMPKVKLAEATLPSDITAFDALDQTKDPEDVLFETVPGDLKFDWLH